MENEYIVLVEFNSVDEGIEFMSNSKHKFSFFSGKKTYDFNGNLISTPNKYDLQKINEILLDISDIPSPGLLYVSDGFLKYYKEY